MNLTIGRMAGHNNRGGVPLLLAVVTALMILGGVGIWQITKSDTSPATVPQVPAAVRPQFSAPSFTPTYFYIVDSQEQVTALLQADFEAQMSFEGTNAIDYRTAVIDISTPEGQEQYRIMNAELTQLAMEDPSYSASLVRIVDLTAGSSTTGVSREASPAVASATSVGGVPTYFYIVETQGQADQVLLAENMSAQEAMFANASSPHHTVIVDVSTLEGQQFLNTLNGDLYEFWDDPTVDQSLIQVIDARQ